MDITMRQPETPAGIVPWVVRVEGRIKSGVTVTIHNFALKGGWIAFPDCVFEDECHFMTFVASMVRMYRDAFNKPLRINEIDCMALMQAYKEGVDRAKHRRIGQCQ